MKRLIEKRREDTIKNLLNEDYWDLDASIMISIKGIENLKTAKNSLTYRRALLAKDLPKTREAINDSIPGRYKVIPKDFLYWCYKNEIPSLSRDILGFMNYEYWLKKNYLSFHEVIHIFSSKGALPPLPHEIINSFESDKKTKLYAEDFAKKLLKIKYASFPYTDGLLYSGECWPEKISDFARSEVFINTKSLLILLGSEEKSELYDGELLKIKVPRIVTRAAKDFVDCCNANSALREKDFCEFVDTFNDNRIVSKKLGNITTAEKFFRHLLGINVDEKKFIFLSNLKNHPRVSLEKRTELKLKFEELSEFEFIFERDFKRGGIDFLEQFNQRRVGFNPYTKGPDRSDARILRNEKFKKSGRLVDFIEWARGYKIKIPAELESPNVSIKKKMVPVEIRSQIAKENVNARHEPIKNHLNTIIEPQMRNLAKKNSFSNHAALAKAFGRNNESLMVVKYSLKGHYGSEVSKEITSAQLKNVAKKIAPEFGIHIAGTEKK